jgi:hypothetical protein
MILLRQKREFSPKRDERTRPGRRYIVSTFGTGKKSA